jgi:hypothetical protein
MLQKKSSCLDTNANTVDSNFGTKGCFYSKVIHTMVVSAQSTGPLIKFLTLFRNYLFEQQIMKKAKILFFLIIENFFSLS